MKETIMTPIKQAVAQLKRSERGQDTCRLLRDLFTSSTINGLDSGNRNAVLLLVHEYICEGKTGETMDELNAACFVGLSDLEGSHVNR